MKKNQLPLLLVLGGEEEENWYELCKEFKDKFVVEQRNVSEIGLIDYLGKNGLSIDLPPSVNPRSIEFTSYKNCLHPTVVIVRMMTRYIDHRLGSNPDFRNILYGLYHSNIPLINGYQGLLSETEKPILYGRLKRIQDKVGKNLFPLIPQYYYPEYELMKPYATVPYVLKVGFPHAGYGKMLIRDKNEFEDAKRLIALGNTYSTVEPFIESQYELRICFIAPDYYRVHKRMSMSWKVNYGMTNIREDTEMTPRYKYWADLIHETYPEMMTFAIDAIVDQEGNEYILEVNGSSQGFIPEHQEGDLIHMRDLCIRKIEEVTGKKIFSDEQRQKEEIFNNLNNDDKILYLQKEIEEIKKETENVEKELNSIKSSISNKNQSIGNSDNHNYSIIFSFVISFIIISIVHFFLYHK